MQRALEIFEVPGALCETFLLRLCWIHFAAAAIISGDIEIQEILGGNPVQSPLVIAGILWPFWNGNLWDRITHDVHILEMNANSYRLKQSRRKRTQF